MKIGIFTFHCAHNYGAVLQAFALNKYLQSLGNEAYVIDYRPPFLTGFPYSKNNILYWVSKSPIRTFNRTYTELSLHAKRKVRWEKFNAFIIKLCCRIRRFVVR